MMKTFCRCARLPLATMTAKLSPALLLVRGIHNRALFGFSSNQEQASVEEGSERVGEGEDRASSFYRNSIRRININDKGRGKFTEHHLLRLIKLTERVEQEPLLFEAYYNYLGHFTLISSTTVDKMLLKALSFEGCSLPKIIEIFENHNHLGYFPHFQVTLRTLLLVSSDEAALHRLLGIFIHSPLIKFDAGIVQQLLAQLRDTASSNTTLSLIVKLLAQRDHFRLLEGIITRRDLLRKFVEAIEARLDAKTFKTFRRSESLKQWCGEVLSSEPADEQLYYEVAVLAVTGKQEQLFGDSLIQIKDSDRLLRCLLYLEECPESFMKAAVKYISSLEISQDLRARLQEFTPSSTEPSAVQSE